MATRSDIEDAEEVQDYRWKWFKIVKLNPTRVRVSRGYSNWFGEVTESIPYAGITNWR
jgi:hypothetical protein